jgi:hypothetical protein
MQYPSKFQVMEPNVFPTYPKKGIASVLSSFGHEQYPSKSIDPWCLITKYPNDNIGFFVSFGKVYASMFQKYVS